MGQAVPCTAKPSSGELSAGLKARESSFLSPIVAKLQLRFAPAHAAFLLVGAAETRGLAGLSSAVLKPRGRALPKPLRGCGSRAGLCSLSQACRCKKGLEQGWRKCRHLQTQNRPWELGGLHWEPSWESNSSDLALAGCTSKISFFQARW